MKQRFQVPKLLNTSKQGTNFLDGLQVSAEEKRELKSIRAAVRHALREGFAQFRKTAKSDPNIDVDMSGLVPKFKTQGSFEYGTLNNPAVCPPQQIDLDDGVYFPMKFIEDQPKLAQKVLCKLVDDMLEKLAESKGWGFEKKDTCARLLVSKRIHVDVPVYAVPESKSMVLEEAAVLKANKSIASYSVDGQRQHHLRLDPNEIYLALRTDEAWVRSDPMKVIDWFAEEQKIHDADTRAQNDGRLTRVCRYLKAWRDETWQKGGPSSITLMAVTVDVFNEHFNATGEAFKTDCEALLAVVREMPRKFAGDIMNPADPEEPRLFPRNLSDTKIQEVRDKVDLLKMQIESALCTATTETTCVTHLICALGQRFPNRPSEVERLTVAATVRSTPAETQASPTANRTFRSA